MRISKGILGIGVVSVIGAVWLWAYGCDKRPTDPPPEPPKDYPVYFMNGVNGTLFTYYPLAKMLDTAALDYGLWRRLNVSADGKLLYLAGKDNVIVIDTDSLEVVTELPYPAHRSTAFSPDNNLVAVMGPDLYILRTSDYSVVYSDTIRVDDGVFSSDSRTFYAVGVDGVDHFTYLYSLNPLGDEPMLVPREFHSHAMHIAPTPDGSKLLLYLRYFLAVYDIALDSLVFNVGYYPGAGYLGMTVDGRYGFFSNPTTQLWEMGTTDLYVFDVVANQISDTIVIDDYLDSLGYGVGWGIGRMIFTPDGRWMIATNAYEPAQVFLFDLATMSFADFHEFGNNHWFGGIGVQQMK